MEPGERPAPMDDAGPTLAGVIAAVAPGPAAIGVTVDLAAGAEYHVAEMEVTDRGSLLCPLCGTVNRRILLELHDRGWIAIGRPGAGE
jgi:hypothetical protein